MTPAPNDDDAASVVRGWLDAFGDELHRFAVRRVRDRHVADDLVQDTLVSALAHVRRRGGVRRPRAFLFAVLRRRIVDHYRRQRRSPQSYDEQTDAVGRVAAAPGVHSGGDSDADLRRRLRECLSRLPEAARSAFELRVVRQLSVEETAETLGIDAAAVASRLYRARMSLRECLRDYL